MIKWYKFEIPVAFKEINIYYFVWILLNSQEHLTRAIDKNFISVFFNFIILQLTRASDKSNWQELQIAIISVPMVFSNVFFVIKLLL